MRYSIRIYTKERVKYFDCNFKSLPDDVKDSPMIIPNDYSKFGCEVKNFGNWVVTLTDASIWLIDDRKETRKFSIYENIYKYLKYKDFNEYDIKEGDF